MLIFDKDLKALPATGHRKPGVTFSVTLQGTGSFAGSPSEILGVHLPKSLLQT